jgi:hypothetical protein
MKRTLTIVVLGLIGLTGCPKSLPELTVLEGRVTIDGQPLPVGYVQFMTVDNVTTAGAELSPEGKYRVLGAPVGPVLISVTNAQYRMTEVTVDDDGRPTGPPKANPLYKTIPAKYSRYETSGLTATIETGQQTFDIELSSK